MYVTLGRFGAVYNMLGEFASTIPWVCRLLMMGVPATLALATIPDIDILVTIPVLIPLLAWW